MIFITLGTQRFPLNRIVDQVKELRKTYKGDIVIQNGYTKCDLSGVLSQSFMDSELFVNYIKEADIVITHGGTSSIIKSLEAQKKVIAVPRLAKFKEHVDDHQLDICLTFEEKGYLTVLKEDEHIIDKIEGLKTQTFNKYISNKRDLLNDIAHYIKQVGEYA
ncbi:PssE/Cps14G family polysaccharide biosynthesis glycosyltransferase [uncultured Metabacillus sp.]|uniref:PssE/Cps14G family polysaccharide biosynthesis glycosyltransferase n=1 Tax=Metabacillus sp. Hm71 TaxID=3450743 RepID=UPI002634E83D|nr:PssE/Cps14G family polysaccharide biosynthesis glycosyltransferase [uncultured Metabacillus sp.]